jgi:Lrp/AsnC family transcriptional regulator for asnA, asnC and gidA
LLSGALRMHEPDALDWQIIRLLMDDGRLSSADISRKLGDVSPRTVTNRIEVLTQDGIINIRSIVNPDKIGYCVLADVFIEVEPGETRTVADDLSKFPQISYIALATGDTDIIISVRAQEIDELYNFVIETIGKIPGVRHTKTFPMPLGLKDITSWLPPEIKYPDDTDPDL